MLNLSLHNPKKSLSVLALGAHCDDIEIGCGGTILSLANDNTDIQFYWIVFTSNEERRAEASTGARLFTVNTNSLELNIHDFRDGFLPYHGEQVKDIFEEIKKSINPDIIFTHYRNDLHQDHRLISDLTWNTFRNHFILEYEIPKWDGDLGNPNTYVHIDKSIASKKIKHLKQAYASQRKKTWFTDDLFWSLLRIRGMESNSPSSYAEAFYTRKNVLTL